jgi:hypothetical protein
MGRPLQDPAEMKCDVLTLTTWCDAHHSGEVVGFRFNARKCDDRAKYREMREIRVRVSRLVNHPLADRYAESIALMDSAYPGWRNKKPGTQVSYPCHII